MLQKYVYNIPKNITDKIKKFDEPSTIIYSNPKNDNFKIQPKSSRK